MEESEIVIQKTPRKEVQETILTLNNGKVTEEEFFSVLKTVVPGTNLRAALDGIIKTGKGALIVIENEVLMPLLDGGFKVNCRFTPQRLIELSKMDGAIVLSKDLKRIAYANVTLAPESGIKTLETGTRHKAADRTSKQIGGLVIAISERKHEISVFYKNVKQILKSADEIMRKANFHVQMLEKQRELFDFHVGRLNKLELRNHPSLKQALQVIQKGRLIMKIAEDTKKQIIELGNEGPLLKTRLKELITGVDRETNLVIKDYTRLDLKKSKVLLESLTYDEILDQDNIFRVLAHEKANPENPLKGWRILSKTSLNEPEIANMIKIRGTLGNTIHSNIETHTEILGQERAGKFKEEIERIKLSI